MKLSSYKLSRAWFNWCFENPEKINSNHSAIYFFAIEQCNRLGWKEKFGLPTAMVCEAIGIKKPQTYIKYFNDLVEWGFFELIQKSKNQHTANIISLKHGKPKNGKALDNALIKHRARQTETNRQSNSPISKPVNKEQEISKQEIEFEAFWKLYDKKVDKQKTLSKYNKLSKEEVKQIMKVLGDYVKSTPDKTFRKNPLTWLNGKCWEDEIITDLKINNNEKTKELRAITNSIFQDSSQARVN